MGNFRNKMFFIKKVNRKLFFFEKYYQKSSYHIKTTGTDSNQSWFELLKTQELTFDHLVPRSRGGTTNWKNVVTACSRCNLRKGNHLPESVKMYPKNKPRVPSNYELQENGRAFPPNHLHESWRDFLYWDSELEEGD